MKEISRRSYYIDMLKAVTIILVLVGHCIQVGSGNEVLVNEIYFDNIVFKIIYSFHMPLFMLISGYLFGFSIKKANLYLVLSSKIKSLLIPIFIWSVIPYVFWGTQFFSEGTKVPLLYAIKKYLSVCLYNLWFLWAIFWCSLIVIVIHKIFKDNLTLYIAIMIIALFVPDILNLSLYKFVYPYFVIGYFGNGKDMRSVQKKENINRVFMCSFVLFIGLIYIYNYDSYIYTSGYCILGKNVWHQMSINLYRFIIGLVGSIFMILLIDKLNKFISVKSRKILVFIGQNTMGIYIISSLLFSYLVNRITYDFPTVNYFVVLGETIVILGICLGCTSIIKQSKILNKYLLGGR